MGFSWNNNEVFFVSWDDSQNREEKDYKNPSIFIRTRDYSFYFSD